MNDGYVKTDPWRLVEDRFDSSRALSSESLFALGNGVMGGRANFEERYSGETLQGNYIGGVYYPDKTRVGWWKNGYPEYFAKVRTPRSGSGSMSRSTASRSTWRPSRR